MASYVLLALLTLLLAFIVQTYLSLRNNIAIAKSTGLRYFVIPFVPFVPLAQLTQAVWKPVVDALPSSWTSGFLPLMQKDVLWDNLYYLYRWAGADTILTVNAWGLMIYTAEPDVITQITTRRNDFPKPLRMYKILDIYGKSVISVEGKEWRKHRKVTSRPFDEKNNHLVWTESIEQVQAMLGTQVGEKHASEDLFNVPELAARMTLAVISKAGYGVKVPWKDEEDEASEKEDQGAGTLDTAWAAGKKYGHTLSYPDAMRELADKIFFMLLIPEFILKRISIKAPAMAYKGYVNWGNYMREMVAAKRAELASEKLQGRESADLLASLLKSAQEESSSVSQGSPDGFTDSEILGNAFLLIVAGHETSANAVHFALVYLAMHPPSQRNLQADIDSMLHDADPRDWDYERDFPRISGGMTGAVLNEILRLIPPVLGIPKSAVTTQTLTVEGGRQITIPPCDIILDLPAVHRNPKYWPFKPPREPEDLECPLSNPDDDLGEFRPERWLLQPLGNGQANDAVKMAGQENAKAEASDGPGPNTTADMSASLLRPPRGAYLPFSDGHRSCLGRRFAQVEVMVILAVFFQTYSVELAVPESDESVEKMDSEERKKIWSKARKLAKHKIRHETRSVLTHRLFGTTIGMRFVRRGGERFADVM